MIKILFCEFKALAKYILLYSVVITILYCMVITFISFSKSALNDVKNIINENSKGSFFKVDTSAYYDEFVSLLEAYDIYNISFNYAYDSLVLSGSMLNGVNVSNGGIITESPNNDEINYGVSSEELDENRIAVSSALAQKLGVSVDDEIIFTIFSNGRETVFYVGAIMRYDEDSPDFLLSHRGMDRLLSDNKLSDNHNITFCINDYDTCRSIIGKLSKNGYSASCPLYEFIHDNVNVIYVTFSGFIAMSIVLGAAIVLVFVSFFIIILIKRRNLITLLIHSGMRLKNIVSLYWMVIELIHIIVSFISIPLSMQMIRWLSNEYYSTFEIEYTNISLDINTVLMIFCIVFCTLGISMMFFSKKLKKINYSITSMKGSNL